MNKIVRYFIFILIPLYFMSAGVVHAQQVKKKEEKIYRSKDETGAPSFSDQHSAGAEEVELKEPTRYDGVKVNQEYARARKGRGKPQEVEAPKLPPYQTLSFLSPKDGEILRENAGNLSISASVSPSLLSGHAIQILMDGNPLSGGGSISLENIDRGSHQLQVRIIQANNQKVFQEGAPISFTLLRHSIAK